MRKAAGTPRPLFNIPLLRAAGVTLKIYARTITDMGVSELYIASGLGGSATETTLPELERRIDYGVTVTIAAGYQRITEDTLPPLERDYKFGFNLSMAAGHTGVTSSTITAPSYEVTETPINGIRKGGI